MIAALTGTLIVCVLLFIDLLTKALAHVYLSGATPVRFLGIIGLDFHMNSGIGFGIADKNPVAMAIITPLTVVMIVAIAVAYFTLAKKNMPARVTLAVIEAGAIGNLIDRLYFGAVRDFVYVKLILPEYICNIADLVLVLGAIALVFIILFIGKDAAFPITKKWRAEAKAAEAEELEEKRKRRERRKK